MFLQSSGRKTSYRYLWLIIAVKLQLPSFELMKPKKQRQEKVVQQIRIPEKSKLQSSLSRATLSKRKEDRANKQNHAQFTESLDKNTTPSKEFTLSETPLKDSTNRVGRIDLKEVKGNSSNYQETNFSCKSKEMLSQQELFQRRLSLKCTNNFSQQLERQKSQRYSMIPLRKDSGFPVNIDERESLYTYQQCSMANIQPKPRQSYKKETIITNLMTKLDHQEDLRSIIESKLKNGSNYGNSNTKDRKSYGYVDTNEDSSLMSSKLKQCETQLSYYKSVIKEMSEKLVDLAPQKNMQKRQPRYDEENIDQSYSLKNDLVSLLKLLTSKSSCKSCERSCKKTREMGTQTTSFEPQPTKRRASIHEQSDFFDNIERTLKVLSNNH